MPVIGDHCGMVEAAHSINEPYFRALLRLVGEDTFASRFQRRTRCRSNSPAWALRRRLSAQIRSGQMGAPIGHIHRYPPR